MTLIVARSENGKAFVSSDTLLSKISGERLSYDQCIVKVAIVNLECCVCFAGNPEPANIAISHLIKANYQTVNETLQYLQGLHQEYNQSVDFGVITNIGGKPALYSLKSGVPESGVASFWLGEHYNLFQKRVLECPDEESLKQKMSNAMDAVIQDGNATSVGGFHVAISSDNDSFQYKDKNGAREISGFSYDIGIQHVMGEPQVIEFKTTGEWQPVGGVSNDNVSTFSSISPYFPGVAIHYMHANMGYFFCPHLRVDLNGGGEVLQSFRFENVTPQEFINKILEEYDIRLKGFVADDQGTITYVNT
jgi:hypothetical protein